MWTEFWHQHYCMTLSYVMQIIALRLMWQHKSQSTWASNSGVDISSQINLSIIEKLFMLIIRNLKSCRLSQVRTWIQFCVWCKFLLNPSQVMFYEQQGQGLYFFLCSVDKFFLRDLQTTIINVLVSMWGQYALSSSGISSNLDIEAIDHLKS